MSPAKAHLFRIALIGLSLVGLGVALWGALWGLGAFFVVLGGYLIFEELRRIANPSLDEEAARIGPAEHLRHELDNPSLLNMAIGSSFLFAVVLAALIDGGLAVWVLIPVVVIQALWIVAIIIRSRARNERPTGSDASRR